VTLIFKVLHIENNFNGGFFIENNDLVNSRKSSLP